MPEAAIDDPWQARMDRMRRLLPMPLLLVSTVLALVEAAAQHTWARFDLSLPWSSRRPPGGRSSRRGSDRTPPPGGD